MTKNISNPLANKEMKFIRGSNGMCPLCGKPIGVEEEKGGCGCKCSICGKQVDSCTCGPNDPNNPTNPINP